MIEKSPKGEGNKPQEHILFQAEGFLGTDLTTSYPKSLEEASQSKPVINWGEVFPQTIKEIVSTVQEAVPGSTLQQIANPFASNEAITIFQNNALAEVEEDQTITDYKVAYKRLNEERNAGWKLNPSDIADFYLLTQFIYSQPANSSEQSDTAYVSVAKAKTRITDIGRRLLVALTHEQLEEYDRFAKVNGSRLPKQVKEKVDAYIKKREEESDGQTESLPIMQKVNLYLSDFKANLDEHSSGEDVWEKFKDKQMFETSLQILESQQTGRWKVMASAMRGLLDKTYPIGKFIQATSSRKMNKQECTQLEEIIKPNREIFLIDRLFNYVHNTGHVSARVTNHFPRSATLLMAHGMPGNADYLLRSSSFLYGGDMLSSQIQRQTQAEGDLAGSFIELVQTQRIPTDYMAALLLEFDNEKLHKVIQSKQKNLSPSRAYQFLRRVTKHDGFSRGRIKKQAT